MSELDHLIAVFDWCRVLEARHPELKNFIHVVNEGKRSKSFGRNMKRAGMAKGFPDIFGFVPRNGYHGLAIEMKDEKGRVSSDQETWIARLVKQGYAVSVCRSSEEGISEISRYLGIDSCLQ